MMRVAIFEFLKLLNIHELDEVYRYAKGVYGRRENDARTERIREWLARYLDNCKTVNCKPKFRELARAIQNEGLYLFAVVS